MSTVMVRDQNFIVLSVTQAKSCHTGIVHFSYKIRIMFLATEVVETNDL